MKATMIITIVSLLLTGSSAHFKHIELSGPDFLEGMYVEFVAPCRNFSCYVMAKGDKKYLAVVDDRMEARCVYEVVGTRKKPVLNLLWVPEKEWI